jgi:D-sedoheptulose 7-phosphate isomerase
MSRFWSDIIAEHRDVVERLTDAGGVLGEIADAIVACFKSGGRVYVFGNGGSAADAQHIAAELLGRYKLDRRALPAIALTTDSSTLTAISNDLGYEQIFARQLEGLVREDDIAWGLSTSGTSANVVAGLKQAREAGALTVGFTGAGGGAMVDICTHLFRAPHASADRIQEAHLLAYHFICERVEAAFDAASQG